MAIESLKHESKQRNNYDPDHELVHIAKRVNLLTENLHDLWARFEDDLPPKYETLQNELCSEIESLRTKALDIVPESPMGALAFADMAMHFGDICDTINGTDLNEKHSGMASLYAKQILNNEKCCPKEASREAKRIIDYADYLKSEPKTALEQISAEANLHSRDFIKNY